MRVGIVKAQRQCLEVSGRPFRFCLAQARTSVPDRSDDGSAVVFRPFVGTAQWLQAARNTGSPAANREIEIVLTISSDNRRRTRSGLWLGLRGRGERMQCETAASEAYHKTSHDQVHVLAADRIIGIVDDYHVVFLNHRYQNVLKFLVPKGGLHRRPLSRIPAKQHRESPA